MYNKTLKSLLRVHASNIPGWRTKRKIVVIESDDWGSIRMSSQDAFNCLLKSGVPVDKSHYNINDSLECNKDLEALFETLTKFKDKTGRPPVMTGVNIMANPVFEKIKASGYTEYFYEPYTETLKRYPAHDKVYELWREGIVRRLFVPIFHGREHLNVLRWLSELKKGNESVLLAFDRFVTGIGKGINGEHIPDLQAAFDIDSPDALPYLKDVLNTGLDLFEQLYGYKAKYFVPTNGPFNNSLEPVLRDNGIVYVNSGKVQLEPLGNGQYKKNIRFLGQRNMLGQIYLTRNCFFEPAATGYEVPVGYDWLDYCLKEIEIAFKWHKPATISSHRVNYTGFLHPENRERGLKQLTELLSRMLKRWPDIEFMTSVELGDLIIKSKI